MILNHIHVTKEGKRLRVAELETIHLLNILRGYFRKANEIFVASQQNSKDDSLNRYKNKLYGYRSVDPETAALAIEETLETVMPYIFEALFRADELKNYKEWEELRGFMQSVLQREGKLDTGLTLLPPSVDQDRGYVYPIEFDDTD